MACRESWRVIAFCLCGLWAAEENAQASPGLNESSNEPSQLARVEIALLGDCERDPVLFERIRSLFPAQTGIVQRKVDRIDQRAVLLPQRADTVYIWIRVTERTNARVYLAISEEAGRARYLFRELRLDAGLDEVGGETLAEVAHSSAQALWLRELQTPRQTLVAALEREAAPPGASVPIAAVPIEPVSVRESAELASPAARRSDPRASSVRLGLGASDSVHASGAEGWLHEPGAFLAFEFRTHLSLRAAVRYLVPAEFALPPAQVRLSGVSGEVRGGWLSNHAAQMRVRLEAGLGVLWGHAQASIVVDQPKAHALPAQDFERVYALAAAIFEWPLGPAWIAAGADLRVPLQTTSYEVSGQSETRVSSALSPGGSLELGIGFDPIVR
ncbi:MAG TPA: hypothetical protein VJV79_30980 [Polyangiaceae bacterium]|nr:hypothetical protein [Polyangiaceae bacterium]